VLIGGDAPTAPMAWARVSGAGEVSQRGVVDEAPPPAIAATRTILVLPGADARLKPLELPTRSEAQARAGAAALFGGALGAEDDLHFAVGAAQDGAGQTRLVAAMSSARLREWLERCAGFGADPHVIVLDCTAWPATRDEIVIAVTPNRTIVAGGDRGGFSIEPALAPMLVARWLLEANAAGAAIVVQGEGAETYRTTLRRDVIEAPLPDPVATLAKGAAQVSASVPNLRQGAFAPAGREAQPFKLWRLAALLFVAAIMLQVGSEFISGWRDQQAAAQILTRAEREFREARPDVRRIVNLRAQVAALANAIEQSGRHPVIVTSEPVILALRQQPLARVDEVRHEAPGRSVRVIVSATDAQSLEAYVATLRDQRIEVEARTIQPREGRYVSELTLEAP
jgi:type II secretion system protein L